MTPSLAAVSALARKDEAARWAASSDAACQAWRALVRACSALSDEAPGRWPLERALEVLRQSAGASLAALYLGGSGGAQLHARVGVARSPWLPPRWSGGLDGAEGGRAVAFELRGAGPGGGVLLLWHSRGGPRAPWLDVMAEGVASLGAALARRLELEALREGRPDDPLTGVLGTCYFTARLEDEADRACRYGVALGLVLVDVDHMTALNGHCGVPAGDRALAELAALLRAQARRSDVVGRTGSDELAWLLPEADAAATAACGERLRAAVAAHAFPRARRLSISVGVASLPRLAADAAQLYQAAERSLTLAKKSGRNRVGPCAPPAVH